jgi:hypothetical protein
MQLSVSVVWPWPCKTARLPPPDPTEPTSVAAIFAGEPSVVQKIVAGLAHAPVAVTVTLCPGAILPAGGLKEIPGEIPGPELFCAAPFPGAELSCADPHKETAMHNMPSSLSLFIRLCPMICVSQELCLKICVPRFVLHDPVSLRQTYHCGSHPLYVRSSRAAPGCLS